MDMYEMAAMVAIVVVLAAALELAYIVLSHQSQIVVRVVVFGLLVKEWLALSFVLASLAGLGGVHPALEIMASALLFGFYRMIAGRRKNGAIIADAVR